jgi:effector-binding domain-containing protein
MALAKVIGRAGWGMLLAAVLFAVAVAGGQAAETAPPPATPAPAAAPPAPAPAAPDTDKPSGDASSAQSVMLQARPVALLNGASSWDDGYKSITESFAKITAALAKAGIKPIGRPLAVFTETDDNGFKFQGMIPIDKPANDKVSLEEGVAVGELPAGRVIKFQHRGPYDDIDSTYEAITAYLDEKGFEAANLFIEEYLNDVKSADDPGLAVDIYVYIK